MLGRDSIYFFLAVRGHRYATSITVLLALSSLNLRRSIKAFVLNICLNCGRLFSFGCLIYMVTLLLFAKEEVLGWLQINTAFRPEEELHKEYTSM